MNKRKLIGTIIGVIAFAALIAGATYAWFQNSLQVTTGTYDATTRNFIINYEKGNNITSPPPVLSTPTAVSGIMESFSPVKCANVPKSSFSSLINNFIIGSSAATISKLFNLDFLNMSIMSIFLSLM